MAGYIGKSQGVTQVDGYTRSEVDSLLSGIASDAITEGNSSVEVVDTGTGYVAVTVDGSEKTRVTPTGLGIGVTAPSTDLHLSSANPTITLTDGVVSATISGDSANLTYTTVSTNRDHFFKAGATSLAEINGDGSFKFNSGYGSVATAYGCRAWVNFNGTGTVAIRASGNVSSVTDNSTGDYTLNFSTAMPDANYNAVAMGRTWPNVQSEGFVIAFRNNAGDGTTGRTASNIRISALNQATNSTDSPYVGVSIFR